MLPFFAPMLPEVVQQAPAETPKSWRLRVGGGIGSTLGSVNESYLSAEGYGGTRWLLAIDATHWLGSIGVGAFAHYSHRRSVPEQGGRKLHEDAVSFGAQVPLKLITNADVELVFTPRLGLVRGWLSFGGSVPANNGVSVGGELSLVPRRGPISLDLGVMRARTSSPGGLGSHDFGGVYLSLHGVLDV